MRSIIVSLHSGEDILLEGLPDNAKITFGPLVPGAKYHQPHNSLRIYTATNNQLCVVPNVVAFRDLAITIRKVKWEEQKATAPGEAPSTMAADPFAGEPLVPWEKQALK